MTDTLDDMDFERILKKTLGHISKEHGQVIVIDKSQIIGIICLYGESDLDDMGDIFYEACRIFNLYVNLGAFQPDCIEIGAGNSPDHGFYHINWNMLR